MNNMQNNSINNIDPFGIKSNKKHYILNSPGYSNQFKTVFRGGQGSGGFAGPQFSRLNLGVPMVNLHHGKGKIIVLGKHNLRPSQSVYNGNLNVGLAPGNVSNNVMINQNGFPNTGGAIMVNQPQTPGQTGLGIPNGNIIGNGAVPLSSGAISSTGTVIKPALVKVFFFLIIE
jgi:hypothetical protein